jgi:hypothetical protein
MNRWLIFVAYLCKVLVAYLCKVLGITILAIGLLKLIFFGG